jgi:hypothetical protein
MKTRALVLVFVLSFGLHHAFGRPMVGVNSSNQLFTFDSTTPAIISGSVVITGLASGDQIHGIDFRPSNGVLYALGIDASTSPDSGRIYTINTATGAATQIGTGFLNLTDSASYGFDFNPVTDQIRVINSADQNLRVNPNTGGLIATDTPLDEPVDTEAIVGAAYDRSDRNPGTSTTLFGIDFQHDNLVRIGGVNGSPSPNLGAVTIIGPTNITTATNQISFDIAEDGVAFASMSVTGPSYRLYTINLVTGASTLIGNIGSGTTLIRGIAAVPSPVANIDSGEFFSTIQAAVADAQTLDGHTIVVNAGTFNELVAVQKGVTFLGARSGQDGRDPSRGTYETIVRGLVSGAKRTSAFRVTADNATIDGFTIQDTDESAAPYGAGVVIVSGVSGTQIRNNIIKNNSAGLIITNDVESNPLVVEQNSIADNNLPGTTFSGTGIFADQSHGPVINAAIHDNVFGGQQNVAVLLGSTTAGLQRNVAIANNTMTSCGNAVLLYNTLSSFITGNTIGFSTGSQVVLGGGVDGVDISENYISDGATRGIRVGDFGGGATNSNVVISCNFIAGNPTAGLEIDALANAYTGTLVAQHNYWGETSGPNFSGNPGGSGDKIIDPLGTQVIFQPFQTDGSDQQVALGFQCYPAPILYAIDSATNNLIRFNSITLGTVTSTPITGMVGGDTIVGLDFRPATGELFGLGSGSRLYVINPATGAAVQRGADGGFVLSGVAFGFDFNPIADRIRLVSDTGQNFRLSPNDGTIVTDTPLAYAAADPRNGQNADPSGSAYLNSYFGATRTTLYHIDTAQNILIHQGSIFGTPVSPNAGQLFSMGLLGVNPDDAQRAQTAFDIYSPVQGVNRAFAALTTNGSISQLYQVDLTSGVATSKGTIGAALLVRALVAAPPGTFEFSASTYSVGESGPVATITINRLRGSEGTVSVLFRTSDGTALSGSDYTDSAQTVTFGPGVTTKTVLVPLNNDSTDEFNETILLSLEDTFGGGGFVGPQSTAVLTVIDDDVATPTLATQTAPAVALGEPSFVVATLTGSATPGGTLIFNVFGPNDSSCGGAAVFTSVVPVNGNGNYVSASFIPTTPGTYRWVVTYSGDGDHNGAVTSGCGAPNQSFDATATVLGNIATRLRVEAGDNALIAGFIITGTQPKRVIVRGIGSSLPLVDKLADPTLELRDSSGALVDANDNWQDSLNKQAIIDSTIPPTNDLESAIVATLTANNSSYTAILRGANNTTGIGVVEAYDLDRLVDSELANISTRGFVQTGDNVLFAGTIVVGKDVQKVLIRAIGPSLGLAGKMSDPTLELRDLNGAVVDSNDNWVDSPDKQAIIDTTIPPTNNLESAIVATLNGNNSNYTAIVRGANGGTGIAVVELYALP